MPRSSRGLEIDLSHLANEASQAAKIAINKEKGRAAAQNSLGNSRVGIEFAKAVFGAGISLIDRMVDAYEAQDPTGGEKVIFEDQRRLRVALDTFLSQAPDFCPRASAFGDPHSSIYDSELERQSDRLRSVLELRIRTAARLDVRNWVERLQRQRPLTTWIVESSQVPYLRGSFFCCYLSM